MRWFRAAAVLLDFVILGLSVFMAYSLIELFVNPEGQKHLESDPKYNGTFSLYLVMLLFQFVFIPVGLNGLQFALRTWKRNYELSRDERVKYIWWLSYFGIICLATMGLTIYVVVKGKRPQEEMSYLYEAFAKANQDTAFVETFEKYQKEKSCCGIYGPDDWLMIQLRTGMGGGGGGGGFQSMDYGFQQNPSTGQCHMLPPKIPMGCGRKMLEQMYVTLTMYSGFLMMETIFVVLLEVTAIYNFVYWLDTKAFNPTHRSAASPSTSLEIGHRSGSSPPSLGPPANPDYPHLGHHHSGSGKLHSASMPIVTHSHNETGHQTTRIGSLGPSPTRFYNGSNHLNRPSQLPHYGSYMHKPTVLAVNSIFNGSMTDPGPLPPLMMGSQTTALDEPKKKKKVTTVHSSNHELHKQEKALGGKILGEMQLNKNKSKSKAVGKDGKKKKHATIAIVRNKVPKKAKTLFSKNSETVMDEDHGQTGNLANDIAVMSGNNEKLRKKLDNVVLPPEDKHNPPPKGGYLKKLQDAKKAEAERERKANEVSGKQAQNNLDGLLNATPADKAKDKADLIVPIVLGENHHPGHGHGGYLATGSHENAHYLPDGAKYLPDGTKYLPGGNHEHAKYLPDGTRYLPAGGHHEHARYLPDGTRYLPAGGHHEHARYLPDGTRYLPAGGHHEHARYLPDGTRYLPAGGHHEHARYLPDGTRYLPAGGHHEHARYLTDGTRYLPAGGHHEHARYLPDGTRYLPDGAGYLPNGGHHENARYLPDGGGYLAAGGHGHHKDARYLADGGHHKDAKYLPAGSAGGHHENARYLPDGGGYLAAGGHGQHKDAKYLADGGHGHHIDAKYLAAGGHHENARYLPDGGGYLSAGGHGHHKDTKYLADGGHGHHKDAKYLAHGGHGHHKDAKYLAAGGHHEHARYLPDGGGYLTAGGHGHHKDAKYLADGSHGHHNNAKYLAAGGHHENAKYLRDGGGYLAPGGHGHHKDAKYLPAGGHGHHKDTNKYLPTGSAGGHHENAKYLPHGGGYLAAGHGHHKDAKYLADGGHHRDTKYIPMGSAAGHHENTRYLPAGGHGNHQDAHHLPPGGHGNHQLPPGGHGNHQYAHHLPPGGHANHQDHYLPPGGHGNHQDAHHLPLGGHGNHQDHYLPPGGHGNHQDAQYLPPGGNENNHDNKNPYHAMNRGEKHHQMNRSNVTVVSKRYFVKKTEIIYKNPKSIDYDD